MDDELNIEYEGFVKLLFTPDLYNEEDMYIGKATHMKYDEDGEYTIITDQGGLVHGDNIEFIRNPGGINTIKML